MNQQNPNSGISIPSVVNQIQVKVKSKELQVQELLLLPVSVTTVPSEFNIEINCFVKYILYCKYCYEFI